MSLTVLPMSRSKRRAVSFDNSATKRTGQRGACTLVDEPALTTLNMRLRDDYVKDCTSGTGRWNTTIENSGVDFRLDLPHLVFHREIGEFASIQSTPTGDIVSDAEWQRRKHEFLPTTDDGDFIASLMRPVNERGAYATWIQVPKVGIDNKPGDFEYVRIAE